MSTTLGVRSDFSLGESLLQIDKLVMACKDAGYDTIALADTMTISTLPTFTEKAKRAGVRPIIGARLRVYDDPLHRPPKKGDTHEDKPNPFFMPKVFVQNENGLKSLMRLLTVAHQADHFYYTGRVGFEELLQLEDCIVTTGDFFGLFQHPQWEGRFDTMKARFGDRFYAELVPIDTPLFDALNHRVLKVAAPDMLVASYPFAYNGDDAATLEVLNAICTNTEMSARHRPKQFVKDFKVEDASALRRRLLAMGSRMMRFDEAHGSEIAVAIFKATKNIETVAARCTYAFVKMPVCLPVMATDENQALRDKAIAGFKRRFAGPVMGYKPADLKPYVERLKYELDVLEKMGFAGYFLLVEDLTNWAKTNDILVGPGRGSVGGSLVSYCLGISDVDPIRFKLLFERFINPERLDLPDADLDFQSSRRHEVVAYLSAKYGADKVAGISNYSSLASSSALRDAGRVHELPPIELTCTKLVPKPHGIPITLTEAADQVSDIEKFKSAYPAIWGHALKLEGAMRSFAQHAAGVVVAGEPLVNRAVVETRNESPVVNWDKRAVEDFGLVKMDILGLSTLDVIQIAKEKAEDLMGGAKIDLMSLPLDDEKVLEAFGKGDTIGVFQFEGGGMRKLLKDLALGGPLTFNDLAATTALFRPGPIDAGLMDDYVSIRQGYKTIFYEHPAMESALKDTFGVIIFQEQVMQLARDVAGFSMAGADHLRKAMGKKDAAKMAEQREAWIDGCLAHVGMPTHTAAELFDKIEKFAGYGFNLSHAVEYTVISWWCMWLKIYHPGAFYAASLTVNDDEGKLGGLVNDAKARGFAVYPPDINLSGLRYHASADRLLAPFHAVKGISDTVATHILAARDKAPGGKFTSREHFESLVNKSKVNQRHRDALDKVGAFADVEAGQPAARDPARLRNQMELLPGIIQDVLKADRLTNTSDKLLRTKVIHIMNEYRSCKACPKQDEPHPAIRMGNSTARYMVVFDGPSYYDGKKNKLLEGDNGLTLRNALKEAGVDPNEGYFTALVKAPKDKGEKFYSNEVLNACTGFLKKELELIKPAVIVTMGGAATRFFLPDVKAQESMGKHVFRADLDATIVVGLNVAQIAFDGTKAANLTEVCEKLAAVLG